MKKLFLLMFFMILLIVPILVWRLNKKMKEKIIKILEYPSIILARIFGVNPLYAYYMESIKTITDKEFRTVIDVGANDGAYIKAVNYYFSPEKIYAFDPVPSKFDYLNTLENTKMFSIGLWDKNDRAEINIPLSGKFDDASSFLKADKENFVHNELLKEGKTNYKKIMVDRKRFDSLGIKILKPSLLKIDIEGTEMFVLKGFGKELFKIDILQIEVNFGKNFKGQPKASELIAYLEKFGFIGFVQKSLRNYNGNFKHCDLIFFKEEKVGVTMKG